MEKEKLEADLRESIRLHFKGFVGRMITEKDLLHIVNKSMDNIKEYLYEMGGLVKDISYDKKKKIIHAKILLPCEKIHFNYSFDLKNGR